MNPTKQLNRFLTEQGVAERSTLLLLVSLKLSYFTLQLVMFWQFATLFAGLIVERQLPLNSDVPLLALTLAALWVIKGASIWLAERAKLQLQNALESSLIEQFRARQYSLVRQHSNYYWQTLWQTQLPAISQWRYDYVVQQYVAGLTPFILLLCVMPINYVIALGLIITMPTVPLFMIIVGKGAASLQRKHFIALERLGALFVDRLGALPLLATLNAFKAQSRLLANSSEQLIDRTMKVLTVAFLSTTVLDFFSTLAMALVAVFVGFSLLGEFVVGPQISLQQGLWLLLSAPLVFAELKTLGHFYHQKAAAQAAFEQLEPVMSAPLPVLGSSQEQSLAPQVWQNLKVDDDLVHAEALHLSSGDWVYLQGPSGSGKTLLLEGLAGQRSCSHQLPSRYGLITQRAVVLPGSLRENLLLDDHIADEQLWQVLGDVGLADWASGLRHGLDTPMGEQPPISGGQAQRLALARLILRPMPVWLLDEPTAHLDDAMHQQLCQLIHRLARNRTIIWSSHKALPSQWFTRTWQVNNGEVREL